MSRTRALGPLLAATLMLAACASGVTTFPVPVPSAPAGAATETRKILAERADALVIQESFGGNRKLALSLPYRRLQLTIGGAHQLKARILVRDAADAPAELTWKTSDPRVATVKNGQLIGKTEGAAVITVEAGGEKFSMDLLVVEEVDMEGGGAIGAGTGGSSTGSGRPVVAASTLPGELVYGREGAFAVNFGGNSFQVVGGSDGQKPLDTKEWAPYIATMGAERKTLGDFILDTDGFIQNLREGLAAVVAGGRIYLIGGDDEGAVEVATSTVDKSPYELVGSTLDTPRRYMATLTAPGWVLVLGGEGTDGGPLNTVEFATRDDEAKPPTFNIGDFSTVSGASLATPRAGLGAAIAGQAVFVIGGAGPDDAPIGSVERATLADGKPGAFTPVAGVELVTPRAYFATVQSSSHVYVLGGRDAAGKALDTIERAPLGEDGTLGAFEVVGYLANARFKAAAAMLDGEIAIAGGRTDAGVTRDVEVIPVGSLIAGAARPSGSPSPTPSPTATPTPTPTATPTP